MKTKNAEYVAQHRQRRKDRDAMIDEVFQEAIKAEGGVQWALHAVSYEPDAINPLGGGLKITWHLSEQAHETLREYAEKERGLTFDAMMREMDAKLLVWFVRIGFIQHDYRLKGATNAS